MQERIRNLLDTFLYEYCIPERFHSVIPKTAVFYIFFGCITTAIDIGVFYIVNYWFDFWYLVSNAIAFVFSSTTNFVTNKYLNYQNKSQKLALQYITHFAVSVSALVVTSLFLYFFVDILGFGALAAKLITSILVAFYSYFVHTKVTFGHARFSE